MDNITFYLITLLSAEELRKAGITQEQVLSLLIIT